MLVVGLTGGIASGKNTVAKMLEGMGARVIDADIISRELVEPGKAGWNEIVSAFGRDILKKNDEIDRKKLGGIVFRSNEKRLLLNAILHPVIIEEEWRRIARIGQDEPDALVVVNAALLIESGNYRDVNVVVVIVCTEDFMLKRQMERDGITEDDASLRLKAQMPIDEKVKYADYLIENNGSIEDLKKKVLELHRSLAASAKAGRGGGPSSFH